MYSQHRAGQTAHRVKSILETTFLEYGKCSKARFFLLVDLRTLLLQFSKKVDFFFNFLIIFLFYPPTKNIICFVEKNNIFL